jgi:DNA-binding GntR family transcriptional regulator
VPCEPRSYWRFAYSLGRRLMARRAAVEDWRGLDVAEHGEILEAVAAGDSHAAAELMDDHVRSALRHWCSD